MHMSNYLSVRRVVESVMATRESREVGIDHLTVVPENLRPDESDEEGGETAGSGEASAAGSADG
jgi:hypothetical protein